MISRVEKRDVVVAIILSIVTCGIYGIYWFVKITDDCGKASGDNSMSGGVSFLLNLVTCGIYGIYWSYQMGKRIQTAQEKRNMPTTDNSALYLILYVLQLSFINWILIQSELNKMAEFDHQA